MNTLSTIRRVAIVVALLVVSGCQGNTRSDQPSGQNESQEVAMREKDLGSVLQLVLDYGELQQYYHVDELPDRKPVRIAKNPALASEPELTKFDAPVVYEDQNQLLKSDRAYFEFPRVIINPDLAYVSFTYSAEGVIGEAWLIKVDNQWQIGYMSVSET